MDLFLLVKEYSVNLQKPFQNSACIPPEAPAMGGIFVYLL